MSRIEKAIQQASRARQIRQETSPPSDQGAEVSPGKNRDLSRLVTDNPLKVNDSRLVCAMPGGNSVAEEYKKLKSVVFKLTQGDRFLNSLLVTSALGEEGKSLTSLNLGMAMAREYDHSVLLVDADLRRPRLHSYLGIEPRCGLLDYLKGSVPLERALVKTGIGKLVLLPAGGVAEDPAELLGSEVMKDLIIELKNRYPDRYVLLDTPPALLFAEAQILSTFVDSALMVVREGVAKVSQIQATLAALHGANIMGLVYNDAFYFGKWKNYPYYY